MIKQLDRPIEKAEELNETLERTDKFLKFGDGIELSIEDGLLTARPSSTHGKGAEAQ